MPEEKRVVLVKPGDVLVIGNLGTTTTKDELVAAMDEVRRLGLSSVLLFTEDIQIDSLTREQIADLAGREL